MAATLALVPCGLERIVVDASEESTTTVARNGTVVEMVLERGLMANGTNALDFTNRFRDSCWLLYLIHFVHGTISSPFLSSLQFVEYINGKPVCFFPLKWLGNFSF